MSEYIKKEEVLERFNNMNEISHDILVDIINHISSVDLTLVFCQDCKYWDEWENGAGSCHRSDIMWVGSDYNDYCSFAERKD